MIKPGRISVGFKLKRSSKMTDFVNVIDAEMKRLQEVFQKQTDYLNQVIANVKQLRAERKNVTKTLAEISGAMQAYDQSVKLAKGEITAAPVAEQPVAEPAVEPEVPVLEGEIVN